VLLEAIRCGADTVGSDVGGVAEVIGKENTVPFRLSADGKPDYTGETFIDSFALKVVNKLFKPASPVLSDEFDWKRTAHDELSFIKEILK
jgi:glycosyltransferase involved in cell wall biosynthesis